MYIQSGLILSEHFPLRLGCSPLIFHRWKPSLVWISGINMGFTSSISKVRGFGIMEWLSRLKLDLEAVEEDASDEVLQFEIQISLIYSKFVGLYIIGSYHHILSPTISDFLSESLQGRIILRNPLVLDSYLSHSSAAFFTIFNSGYTP